MMLVLAAAVMSLGMVGGRSMERAAGRAVERLAAQPKRVVVVELFTSEGCSSCPPADVLVKDLVEKQPAAGVEIVGLGWHVDYWDGLGWKDPFSSAEATERQREYGRVMKLRSVYTPQAVVDGSWEGVGSDERQVRGAIAAAVAQEGVALAVQADGDQALVSVPEGVSGSLELVVTEAGLTTEVRRGENAGRKLVHAPVVRKHLSLGAAAAGEKRVDLHLDGAWKRENLRLVALVTSEKHEVVAAGACGLKAP